MSHGFDPKTSKLTVDMLASSFYLCFFIECYVFNLCYEFQQMQTTIFKNRNVLQISITCSDA